MKQLLLVVFILLSSCFAFSQTMNKVDIFAHAIARAEGYAVKGSIPNRYHNPGDLKVRKGAVYPGQIGIGKARHVIFKNPRYGWAALHHQIEKILNNDSQVYNRNMTLHDMAKRYAVNYKPWEKNVARILRVSPSIQLWEYFDLPPLVVIPIQGDFMRIGIDVDGVLSDTLVAIHRKFKGWDTTKGWYGGFTKEEFDAVWADAKNTHNFWMDIPVVQRFNHRLMIDLNSRHDLYFITDRFDTVGGSAVRQTLDWISFNLLAGYRSAGVIVAKNKGPVAASIGLDMFIDDKPENCLEVESSAPSCKVYLCTLPHNLSYTGKPIPRVENFNAFAKLILEAN